LHRGWWVGARWKLSRLGPSMVSWTASRRTMASLVLRFLYILLSSLYSLRQWASGICWKAWISSSKQRIGLLSIYWNTSRLEKGFETHMAAGCNSFLWRLGSCSTNNSCSLETRTRLSWELAGCQSPVW
jgi:hypothetical protein